MKVPTSCIRTSHPIYILGLCILDALYLTIINVCFPLCAFILIILLGVVHEVDQLVIRYEMSVDTDYSSSVKNRKFKSPSTVNPSTGRDFGFESLGGNANVDTVHQWVKEHARQFKETYFAAEVGGVEVDDVNVSEELKQLKQLCGQLRLLMQPERAPDEQGLCEGQYVYLSSIAIRPIVVTEARACTHTHTHTHTHAKTFSLV